MGATAARSFFVTLNGLGMEIIIQNFTDWRNHSRALLAAGVHPGEVSFTVPQGSGDLFGEQSDGDSYACGLSQQGAAIKYSNGRPLNISRDFIRQAHWVGHHSLAQRWQLLYSLAWRQIYEDKKLLQNPIDQQVALFHRLLKAVSRDHHKMKAFVRFQSISEFSGADKVHQAPSIIEPEELHLGAAGRKGGGGRSSVMSQDVVTDDAEHFVAWFEPDHAILPLVAPFFVKRFSAMNWSILTPHECVHWHQEQLIFTDGAARPPLPEDKTEQLWLQYYASIFNPARVKVSAMQSEMPKKYWKNLPEAQLIQTLLQRASSRVDAMFRLGNT